MTEFHRWKGERLKEKNRLSRPVKRRIRQILTLLSVVLAFFLLLAVVWVMFGGHAAG
ncbi:hypothetical protein B1857_004428 [Salmonella enterica]|nr:hypothetical protein [Salmonella enterica]